VEIDVEEIRLAGRSMHDMAFPDLLGERLWGGHLCAVVLLDGSLDPV
jgi:hypothetical protein